MEEGALHDLGKGQPEGSATKKTFAKQVVQTPLSWASCPTRRAVEVFAVSWGDIGTNPGINIAGPLTIPGSSTYWAARADYSANASDVGNNEHFGGPGSYAAGDMGSGFWTNTRCPGGSPALCGISYERSQVKLKDVKDGVSKVYFVGEKYLNKLKYGTGSDAADNEFWNVGYDNDMFKTADREPASDGQVLSQQGVPQDDPNRYGGAHDQAFHVVMGDGSVHRIPYEIDLSVHRKLAHRQDGLPVQLP
jgi:hypothetical protein